MSEPDQIRGRRSVFRVVKVKKAPQNRFGEIEALLAIQFSSRMFLNLITKE